MNTNKVFLVMLNVRERHTDEEHSVLAVYGTREKAEKRVEKDVKKLAKDFGLDLSNIDEEEWDVVSNKRGNYEMWDVVDYCDGFAIYVVEKEVE